MNIYFDPVIKYWIAIHALIYKYCSSAVPLENTYNSGDKTFKTNQFERNTNPFLPKIEPLRTIGPVVEYKKYIPKESSGGCLVTDFLNIYCLIE